MLKNLSKPIQLTIRILLLVAAYVVAGRLSLLLAIPPGFVTGIFLPLGISLGALLIWGLPMVAGVVIGSTLLNISVAMASGQPFSTASLSIAVEIAIGSGLASLTGAVLIRRFVGFPDNLTDERKIFRFFILGGPVAAIISACVGVFALYSNDVIHAHQIFQSLWTWWIGDAIGVLIATPLMCILFAEPRHFWRNRLTTVAIPLVLSSMVVVIVFIMASVNEQKKLEAQFQQNARLVAGAIEVGFSSAEYVLVTLSGLFIASEDVSREEFSAYVNHVVIKKKGISGFSWNRYVKNTERKQLETELLDQGFTNFAIKEKDAAGNFVVASEREDYVVIFYIEPWEKNAVIHGFDVSSDPVRKEALNRAKISRSFALTQPLQLLQDEKYTPGVVAYYPVYKQLDSVATSNDQSVLIGYATAIVRTHELINEILKPFKKENFQLHITDLTPDTPVVFFSMGDKTVPAYARDLLLTEEITVGGRQLEVQLIPTQKFLSEQVSLQSWFVLAGGLLFCSLLGGFLLLVSGRTQHISDMVDQRTQELEAILEDAVESILVVDESGIIQKANPAAAKLFVIPVGRLINTPIGNLIPSVQHLFSGVTVIHEESDDYREASGFTGNGNEVPIELSISRVEVHDRRLFTFIIHDITARRKMDRMKAEFISTVSHELRTPLTSIRGALGIVLSGNLGELSIKIEDLLMVAKRNVERLSRLVNDILDIDKLEYNQMQFNLVPCAVYPLLQQAVEQNQVYANRYSIQLILEDTNEETKALCANLDADRFLQVMSNLISNAVKFSNRNSQVHLRLERHDGAVRALVIDQGQGIPEEFRSRIFQKFAQVDSSDTRHKDGTGLGLSITKIIVERLGGTIDYESVEGKGSQFYVCFPIVEPKPSR